MSIKKFDDLPLNVLSFIYQYLDFKDRLHMMLTNHKMNKAGNHDFLYIELAKRNILFLPQESDTFDSWKDYYNYLRALKPSKEQGKPSNYKMIPYRGHKAPITTIEYFNNKKKPTKTIVSGDSSGEVLTWNIDEDGDQEKDLIFKANDAIKGIKNLIKDSTMLVWTIKNEFYYYEVNMYKETNKNSERFQLIKNFKLDTDDNPIEQVNYDESFSTIFMSPDLSDTYKLNYIYSYDLKTFTMNKYHFDYNSLETNNVLNGTIQRDNNMNNNNNNLFLHPQPMIPPPFIHGQPFNIFHPHMPIIHPNPPEPKPAVAPKKKKKNIFYTHR